MPPLPPGEAAGSDHAIVDGLGRRRRRRRRGRDAFMLLFVLFRRVLRRNRIMLTDSLGTLFPLFLLYRVTHVVVEKAFVEFIIRSASLWAISGAAPHPS